MPAPQGRIFSFSPVAGFGFSFASPSPLGLSPVGMFLFPPSDSIRTSSAAHSCSDLNCSLFSLKKYLCHQVYPCLWSFYSLLVPSTSPVGVSVLPGTMFPSPSPSITGGRVILSQNLISFPWHDNISFNKKDVDLNLIAVQVPLSTTITISKAHIEREHITYHSGAWLNWWFYKARKIA